MNEPAAPRLDEAAIAQTDPRVTRDSHAGSSHLPTLLLAIGAGLALGVIIRALRPEPTRTERLAQRLADLEERLRHSARPALRSAAARASSGAQAVRDGLHTGEALLAHRWRRVVAGLRRLCP